MSKPVKISYAPKIKRTKIKYKIVTVNKTAKQKYSGNKFQFELNFYNVMNYEGVSRQHVGTQWMSEYKV